MTLLEQWSRLHLDDLRQGSNGRPSRPFLDALEVAVRTGQRKLWREARQFAGEQYSREKLAFEDERCKARKTD